jgi:hypothetical protein
MDGDGFLNLTELNEYYFLPDQHSLTSHSFLFYQPISVYFGLLHAASYIQLTLQTRSYYIGYVKKKSGSNFCSSLFPFSCFL